MSTLLRLFTLFTIAAAGFALPMTCAQGSSAAAPVTPEIAAVQQIDPVVGHQAETTGNDLAPKSITQHLFDTLPLDCGDGATPRVAEQPALFDTQPFVPGYLVSSLRLGEEAPDFVAPPPAMIPSESRAGPPDPPPPQSID